MQKGGFFCYSRFMANKVTTDQLAQMVARGFEQTATKEDLKHLGQKIEQKFDEKIDNLKGKMEAGFSDVEDKLIPRNKKST